MKNSQKGFVVPLLIVIAVLVIGGGIYYHSRGSSKPTSYLNADLTNTYTVLADENLWRAKLIASENPEAWQVSTKNITVKAIDYQGNFSCGDKKAEFIKYSSFNTGAVGGWGSVSVVDCGSYYFIFDYGDAGPKLFGPFDQNTTSVSKPTSQTNSKPSSASSQNSLPNNPEILSNLVNGWKQIALAIIPSFPDPSRAFYGYPYTIQFIGKNRIIVSYQNDFNPLFAVLSYNPTSQKFSYLDGLRSSPFEVNEVLWNTWRSRYGDASVAPQTYQFASTRTGDIVYPSDWKLVTRNPFISTANSSNSLSSTITIISPNGREVWVRGSQHNITWKPYNGLVTILLIPRIPTPNLPPNAGAMPPAPYPMVNVAENVDGSTGSYSWTVITSSLAGVDYVNGDYYIKICSKDGTICDQSNSDFTIASSLDFQLQYSGMTDTNREFSVKYPITWTYYKFSCNSDGVSFWPKSLVPDFSQGSACSANGFLNSAPIVVYTMSQPTFNLQNASYTDIYNQMSASLKVY